MQVNELSISHFRNITEAAFFPHPELTVICGNNGQGKTNLLEAVWLLTGGKSFRGGKDVELIQKNHPFSVLEGKTLHQEIETDLRITISPQNSERPGRQGKKNGVAVGRATALAGVLQAVVFAPNHLSLVKGSPDGRRRFIDAALCQLYPGYLLNYRRYSKAILQKNAFLKKYFDHAGVEEQTNLFLDSIDLEIVKQGELLQAKRISYLNLLSPIAIANYHEISHGAETLSLRYMPQFEPGGFAEKLKKNRARELAARCCLYGPHREDFEILLNGEPAKVFASQGQQRSAVLSLKLAEATSFYQITDAHPIMLLDDVLSELDESRQRYLLTRMQGKQVFVTSCDEGAFAKTDGKIVTMNQGVLTQEG